MSRAPNVSLGDRDTALANKIVRVEVGSGVHGMALGGTDDLDLMGVYVERREQLLGLAPTAQHYVSRTVPEGHRSGPGDIDLTIYALRKFLRLATAGNPTVLVLLYAPDSAVHVMTPLGQELRALAPAVVSRLAVHRFLGYLDGQRERMLGVGPRTNRVPNRPELVERHGYDTKYASHALRLGLQGIQVARIGRLTLPMPADDLASALEVKRGEVDQAEALRRIDAVRDELAATIDEPSVLRDEPDLDAVNAWLVHAHETRWAQP